MEIKCGRCGGITNTAICDHNYDGKDANFCYLRYENNQWVDGCVQKEEANPFIVPIIREFKKGEGMSNG